jgi:folate-binding protein YgfZ
LLRLGCVDPRRQRDELNQKEPEDTGSVWQNLVAILGQVAATEIDTTRLDAEYRALTEGCGLLDRSERGKLALTGSGAKEFLAGQVTNDTEALAPGQGCDAAFLTPKGKMLGDLRVLDLGDELLLDTERTALQALFDMIRRFKIGYDVQLHKRTVERGLLSLLGPDAARVAGTEGLPAVEHANAAVEIDGIAAIVARTDSGVDLICDVADTDALAGKLRERGAAPVSKDAAEIVRVERGRPRYGIDLDETVIPQEAGLNERAVSFTKGCYVGQETVARLYYKGKPNRHLRGLRLSEPTEPGAELRLGERVVGHLTSAVLSPAHGPIGLALVRREAELGTSVSAGERGAEAEVVELPFRTTGADLAV